MVIFPLHISSRNLSDFPLNMRTHVCIMKKQSRRPVFFLLKKVSWGGVIMQNFDVKGFIEVVGSGDLPDELKERLQRFMSDLDERKKSLEQSPKIPFSPDRLVSCRHNTYPVDS